MVEAGELSEALLKEAKHLSSLEKADIPNVLNLSSGFAGQTKKYLLG